MPVTWTPKATNLAPQHALQVLTKLFAKTEQAVNSLLCVLCQSQRTMWPSWNRGHPSNEYLRLCRSSKKPDLHGQAGSHHLTNRLPAFRSKAACTL